MIFNLFVGGFSPLLPPSSSSVPLATKLFALLSFPLLLLLPFSLFDEPFFLLFLDELPPLTLAAAEEGPSPFIDFWWLDVDPPVEGPLLYKDEGVGA